MQKKIITLSILLILYLQFFDIFSAKLTINKKEVSAIGYRIYKNECGLDPNNLTHWNDGEDFASLGIGHFIWYHSGGRRLHEATFPKLIKFFISKNVSLPGWLRTSYMVCPWNSKVSFYKDFDGNKMKSLRALLKKTMYLQTLFIIYRFNDSIPSLIRAASRRGTKSHVVTQLYRVIKSPLGLYALIDYSNFKGMGTNDSAKWGLLQVLENMKGSKVGRIALYDFAKSAAVVLKKRVINSQNRTQEEKWYSGWVKRLETYYM